MDQQRSFHCQLDFEGFDGSALSVASLVATEALDSGHEVVVEASTDTPFDPSDLLGQVASVFLTLDEEGNELRAFHGYVFEAKVTSVLEDRYRVRLTIRARLELLALGRDSRIFQEQSVPDIVSAVLDGAGLTGAYEWNVGGTYDPRPHVVQYNESDLVFIKRLLADEGIAFAIRNDINADSVVFFDDSTSLPVIEGESTLIDSRASQLDVDVVSETHDVHRAVSDAAMLRDYDYTKPSSDLSSEAEGESSAGRQVYVHPGGFSDAGVGQTRL
jgi:type VI secretion system secreted protein VgrG